VIKHILFLSKNFNTPEEVNCQSRTHAHWGRYFRVAGSQASRTHPGNFFFSSPSISQRHVLSRKCHCIDIASGEIRDQVSVRLPTYVYLILVEGPCREKPIPPIAHPLAARCARWWEEAKGEGDRRGTIQQ